jgi:hypothetical protein
MGLEADLAVAAAREATTVTVEIAGEAEDIAREEMELVRPVAITVVSRAIGPMNVTTNNPRKRSRHMQLKTRNPFFSLRLWSPTTDMTLSDSPPSKADRIKEKIPLWR